MIKISSQLIYLFPLAIGIGIAMAFQTAMNAQLREFLYSPFQAALLSFAIGTILLIVIVVLQPSPKPDILILGQIPWFLWLGGCLGVYAISMSIFTAPKLGFLTLTGLIIFGQIIMSMLLDHFGLFSIEKIVFSWQRLFGAIIIFVGVLLTLQR